MITLNRSDLLTSLKTIAPSVGVNATLPILGNVHIQPHPRKAQLTLLASDLDTAIRCPVPAQFEDTPSAFTLPHRHLQALVNSFDDDQIQIEIITRRQSAILTCGDKTAEVKTIPADEYPLVPSRHKLRAKAARAVIIAADLHHILRRTLFAAAADYSRPTLSGIYMHSNGNVKFVATDGYRLSIDTLAGADGLPSAIIPAIFMQRVQRLLRSAPAEAIEIGLTADGKQVYILIGDIEIAGPVLEANYPDYEKIIPPHAETAITVETVPLLTHLQTAKLYALGNRVQLTFAADAMTLNAKSPEYGEFNGRLPIHLEGAANVDISLNVDYLRQAVKVCGEYTSIRLTASDRPAVIRSLDAAADFIHVLMPLAEDRIAPAPADTIEPEETAPADTEPPASTS